MLSYSKFKLYHTQAQQVFDTIELMFHFGLYSKNMMQNLQLPQHCSFINKVLVNSWNVLIQIYLTHHKSDQLQSKVLANIYESMWLRSIF
jgi:hypothetical protein